MKLNPISLLLKHERTFLQTLTKSTLDLFLFPSLLTKMTVNQAKKKQIPPANCLTLSKGKEESTLQTWRPALHLPPLPPDSGASRDQESGTKGWPQRKGEEEESSSHFHSLNRRMGCSSGNNYFSSPFFNCSQVGKRWKSTKTLLFSYIQRPGLCLLWFSNTWDSNRHGRHIQVNQKTMVFFYLGDTIWTE